MGGNDSRESADQSRLLGNPKNLFSSAGYPSPFQKALRQISVIFLPSIISGTMGAANAINKKQTTKPKKRSVEALVMDCLITRLSDVLIIRSGCKVAAVVMDFLIITTWTELVPSTTQLAPH